MKRPTRVRRQTYVWAKFFILEFTRDSQRKRPRVTPASSATQGFGSAVRWR